MNKTNYDTKSSIFSAQYKIPYDCSESSRIVQHLQESQQQLQFLKYKLTEAYEKLEQQIRNNMAVQDQMNDLFLRIKEFQEKLKLEQLENKKLKQVMSSVLENRKMIEEEVEYTHKRYKKLLHDKQMEQEEEKAKLLKKIQKLQNQIEFMSEELSSSSSKHLIQTMKHREVYYENKISILEHQISKLTNEKVAQISRLKQQIQCYQRNMSPIKQYNYTVNSRATTNMETQPKVQNVQLQYSGIHSSKMYQQSKSEEQSIGKWKRSNKFVDKSLTLQNENAENRNPNLQKELTDDQRLTKCQIQKKNTQNKLIKIERLKRHTPEDRVIMEKLEKKLYQLDSQISTLKRRIRQKY